MLFYPQVTTIQPLMTIQRERLLPDKGNVLVGRGQHVSPVQVLANAPRKIEYMVVPLAQQLGIPANELSAHLQVQVEQDVRQGNPLAQKKSFLGRNKVIKSPVTGTIAQIRDGVMVIEKNPVMLELRALMNASVAAIYMGRGVLLETYGTFIEGMWDSGKEGVGKLKLMTDDPTGTVAADAVSLQLRGSILAMGKIVDTEMLAKAEDSGVRGIIAGTMPASLRQVAATVSFPILLTDGFGTTSMAHPIFDLLGQSQGRETTLFSRKTANSDSRPAIVIPLPTSQPLESTINPNDPLTVGHVVRVIRGKNAGNVGAIQDVYVHGKTTPAGIRVPGADIKLADDQIVFIPFGNLDLLI